MGKTAYYSVTVKKFNILTRHLSRMEKTQKLYNEILRFYYNLYLDLYQKERDEELPEDEKDKRKKQPGSMEAMRLLEKLTITGRDKQPVPYPFPWEKVPLYFRRAAINGAISAAKSYISRNSQMQPKGADKEKHGRTDNCSRPFQKERTGNFAESVTFYKGMYRDFGEKEISLKLWDGEQWIWTRCRLRGNKVPKAGQMMSPALVLKNNHAELHIPWKTPVDDGRNIRERMNAREKLCSVTFTNKDACVICCVMNADGMTEASLFLRGGAEYAHRCRYVIEKLEKSRKSCGGGENPLANRRYWEKLKNLNDYYAHYFSRQVITYCENHKVRILVLPEYETNHRNIIMTSAGNFSPIHLSMAIRKNLKYKAWQAGIIILEMHQYNTNSVCSFCGGKIRTSGSEYICENGHRGNRYLNTAKNLGLKCLESFQKKIQNES